MICFDTNILIYIANGTIGTEIATKKAVFISDISKVEALGYWDIRSAEEAKISDLIDTLVQVPIDQKIIDKTIALRQLQKMSLGDALVAATALNNSLELWTVNTKDFEHITNLKLHNPLKSQI